MALGLKKGLSQESTVFYIYRTIFFLMNVRFPQSYYIYHDYPEPVDKLKSKLKFLRLGRNYLSEIIEGDEIEIQR